jgi:hypothetical protein
MNIDVLLVERQPINLPCGATAHFAREAGYGHRCNTCFAVVGSVGMPRDCAERYAAELERTP